MILREFDTNEIKQRIRNFKVTAIVGPRQSGKTTIARQFKASEYFDLENPRDMSRLNNSQTTLEKLKGLIVIDEVQRKPDLFPLLRFLVDSNPMQKYLILGSASPHLLKQSSESLAGRIAYYNLEGLRKSDIPENKIEKLWLRGGLPLSFLSKSDSASFQWREQYIKTFLERDIPMLGIKIPADTLRRFWMMISHYHGNIVNLSEIGRSFGIADTTVQSYLDILKGTFMIRLLQPWHTNIGKRLVKRPKVYFRDSGIFHSLLSVETQKDLQSHPKLGASWEGFALESAWRSINKPDENAYFWATHAGAEADLFWQANGKNWACEFKYTDAPTMTKSIASALKDLNLKKMWIIYPGNKRYFVDKKVEVLPLSEIQEHWEY
jgi:hypothetical protein